ncbi:Hpt domain-containing protein [Arthrobacter sp. TMP15]|uniref:Hpt domain-containing protein n=1 Tax=Arthrobacter sp. TMP15 TaxID=3140789 RepID=UPI0031B9BA6A
MTVTMMPLVCTETLHTLEESLNGETALCRSFVCRFIDMWPERFRRIHQAVKAGHLDNAMDAALSLRSSSMMVGAAQLGELASDLVRTLESGCNVNAARQLRVLRQCGNLTAAQLTSSYVNAA